MYSGRTTAYRHKFNNWKENGINIGEDCIKNVTVFDVQWSNCPIEVEEEVKQLWRDREMGNDYFYVKWDDEEDKEDYPKISEYLTSRNVNECLIHWWW